jgi:hypothetical protein
MNIDYSVCQALMYNSKDLPGGMVIYDKFCQWFTNFHKRVRESNFLSIPESMVVVGAVDKFHLVSHVPECFVLYSLNFLPGAAQICGVVLESNWRGFNKVSPSARSMSGAHRREVYDDYMRESNFKKMIAMRMS